MPLKDFTILSIHEDVEAGQNEQARETLKKLTAFLEEFYPHADVATPDTFLKQLMNNTAATPFVTLYTDQAGEPQAAIVAYAFRTRQDGIGFIKYAVAEPGAQHILAGEIIEHLLLITDKLSVETAEYRGTFVEVYEAPDSTVVPSLKEISTLLAKRVALDNYTVPAPGLHDTPGRHFLYVTDYDEPDEPTLPRDVETFIHKYANLNGYTLSHSYPKVEAMFQTISDMVHEDPETIFSDKPIQTPITSAQGLLALGKKKPGNEPGF